jgi:UDP-N-acetylmuramyl tripeptide synthase
LPALSCDTIIIEDVQQALEYTPEHAKKDDIILACGSVFNRRCNQGVMV